MFAKRLFGFLLDILEVIVFAVAIFLFFYLLVVQPHKIKGESMEPNYHNGEYLLTDKVTYRFGLPKRGDVIVFEAPTNNSEEFIKRIMGLPGEKVSLQNGSFYINGKQVDESYLSPNTPTFGGNFLIEGSEKVVPEGEYFVMGDNRNHSSDSRTWGFVPKAKITGRAWFIYWPPSNFGTVEIYQYSF